MQILAFFVSLLTYYFFVTFFNICYRIKGGTTEFLWERGTSLGMTFYRHKNLCNTLRERIMHDVSPLLPAPTFLFEDKRVN